MKKALIIIGGIIALFLIVALFLPSSVHVERSIEIEAPVDLVFDQVNDLEKNFNWSPWMQYDPNMQVEWGEKRAGLGASYSWMGNKDVGSGTLTIEESVENEFIKNDLDFGEMGKGKGTWKFEPIYMENDEGELEPGQSLVVTWGMDSELDYPIGRYFGLMMDSWVGKDFEKGLASLKEVAESLPVQPKIVVEEVQTPEMTVIAVKDSVPISMIGSKMGENMGILVTYLETNQLTMMGAPMCIYHIWNEEQGYTVMECALPVSAESEAKASENVIMHKIPAGPAAKVVHMGSYESLGQAHYAIDEWVTSNERQVVGSPFEVYMTDPQAEPDTSKWTTEVYYPIQ